MLVEDDRPLVNRGAARLPQGGQTLWKTQAHLCDALTMQVWDDHNMDAVALVTLGVGGPKLLPALNKL